MQNQMHIGSKDIRIISHCINFALNLQENYSRNRIFDDDLKQRMRIIFNELIAQQNFCNFSKLSVIFQVGLKYLCEDGKIELPLEDHQLILDVIAFLHESLLDFPGECETLTGSTLFEVETLFKAMKMNR